jgi:hypothetical protein
VVAGLLYLVALLDWVAGRQLQQIKEVAVMRLIQGPELLVHLTREVAVVALPVLQQAVQAAPALSS